MGSWKTISDLHAPQPRAEHVIVFTGSHVLIWGGRRNFVTPWPAFGDGALYDVTTDRWTPMTEVGAPAPRAFASGVWMGSRLLVWGGSNESRILPDGAAYDPCTDSWSLIATAPIEPRTFHITVWSGSEMIVWGGMNIEGARVRFYSDGAAYSPATDTWRRIPEPNFKARRMAKSVWTGEEMLIWGGDANSENEIQLFGDGIAYRPSDDSWHPLPVEGSPIPRHNCSAVWTGDSMILFGGAQLTVRSIIPLGHGAIYNRGLNRWYPLTEHKSPSPRFAHVAAWIGNRMFIWGGTDGLTRHSNGACYTPATGEWTPLPSAAKITPRVHAKAVPTDIGIFIWGGGESSRGVLFVP